jgi:hypothetical protein
LASRLFDRFMTRPLVDLQLAERHLEELRQRRIAGAEIVEREDRCASRAAASGSPSSPWEFWIVARFRDLEDELTAVDAGLGEQRPDAVRKGQVRDETRRQIHRARQTASPGLAMPEPGVGRRSASCS